MAMRRDGVMLRTGVVGVAMAAVLLASVGCEGNRRTSRDGARDARDDGRYATTRTSDARRAQGNLSHGEMHFLQSAGHINAAEIATNRLALERAQDQRIRQHAQMMLDDHTRAQRELEQLADQLGVDVPGRPDEAHRELAAHLRQMDTREFEREYLGAMVAGHSKSVAMFEDKARNAQNAQVRAYAQRHLPGLQNHLRMSRDMHAQMTGMGGVGSMGTTGGMTGHTGGMHDMRDQTGNMRDGNMRDGNMRDGNMRDGNMRDTDPGRTVPSGGGGTSPRR